jgi:hypothetical protein
MSTERQMAGRRFYPASVVTIILERLTKGESITSITADPSLPCRTSWFLWCGQDHDLQARYEAALAARRQPTNV